MITSSLFVLGGKSYVMFRVYAASLRSNQISIFVEGGIILFTKHYLLMVWRLYPLPTVKSY